MIPNLSLATSTSSAADSTTSTGFGDYNKNASYMGGGQPSIAGGGTGMQLNIPINFGESQSNSPMFEKRSDSKASPSNPENNNIVLFGILGLMGILVAIVLGRK